jgi:hypothetical protein
MLGQSTSRTKTAVGVSSVKKIGRRSRDEVDAQPLQHVMARELDGQVRGEPVGTLHNDGPDPVAGNPLQHRHEPGHARSQDQCHSSQRRTASGRLRPSSRSSRTSSDRSGGRGKYRLPEPSPLISCGTRHRKRRYIRPRPFDNWPKSHRMRGFPSKFDPAVPRLTAEHAISDQR